MNSPELDLPETRVKRPAKFVTDIQISETGALHHSKPAKIVRLRGHIEKKSGV